MCEVVEYSRRYAALVHRKSKNFADINRKTFFNCVRPPLSVVMMHAEKPTIEIMSLKSIHMKLCNVNTLVLEFERRSPDIAAEYPHIRLLNLSHISRSIFGQVA